VIRVWARSHFISHGRALCGSPPRLKASFRLRVREDFAMVFFLNIVGEESPVSGLGEAPVRLDGHYHEADAEVLLRNRQIQSRCESQGSWRSMEACWFKARGHRENSHDRESCRTFAGPGKSVLVTQPYNKALRMVRHHIVPELRPCA